MATPPEGLWTSPQHGVCVNRNSYYNCFPCPRHGVCVNRSGYYRLLAMLAWGSQSRLHLQLQSCVAINYFKAFPALLCYSTVHPPRTMIEFLPIPSSTPVTEPELKETNFVLCPSSPRVSLSMPTLGQTADPASVL